LRLRFRSYQKGDEKQIVKILNQTYHQWGSEETWRQKFLQSADFDPGLIVLGEENGTIASCVHYIHRDMWLNNHLLRSYVGGDGATLPEYSNRGLFSKGLKLLYDEVKARNGACVYGYNTPAIYKNFYRKRFGEVAVFRPRVFIKILDYKETIAEATPIINRFIGKRPFFPSGKGIIFRLILEGQTLDFAFTNQGLKKCESTINPDLLVEAKHLEVLPYAFSGLNHFLHAFVMGKIRIKINGSSVPKLIQMAMRGLSKLR
jgi:hypothetical protein